MAAKTKSPLKDKPLRNPGQSLDERIRKVVDDYALFYVLMPAALLAFSLIEWFGSYFDAPRTPLVPTIMAVMALPIAVVGYFRKRSQLERLKLGRDGEMAVGQYLEKLRSGGAQVYHDIPGDNFNIDHVLITGSGVYLIETKTYSKPAKGETVVVFDGESLLINRSIRTSRPVIQAKAGAKWLSELLEQSTGRRFPVRPVLTFPGWFIEPTAEAKKSDVWVLNPKALPSFIENSRTQLSLPDQKVLSGILCL